MPQYLIQTNTYRLLSPNEELVIYVTNLDNLSCFYVKYKGNTILQPSKLGLQVNDINFTENVSLKHVTKKEFDETWTTINGKQTTVRNHYNEHTIKVVKTDEPKQFYEIIFRIYDKSFAYRYTFSNRGNK